jgi:predicted Ser/Thr protein kinase
MTLAPGTRHGPYEIRALLGEGGMGRVYRAHDATLNREVALKVLGDLVANDPDRLARFKREAQVLASLNHPNIAQIYGVEGDALVLELVEGPTLEEIIRGPGPTIPLADALKIASQIAQALEAAHELGIVHRDLKPANIKVRPDGTVKVLDFGLAKALAPESASATSGLSNSPTLTARATQLGMILGTAAYMAPEQARGRNVDRRADVWAFGVVVYEMLTGRRAFEGSDVTDVLASVLKDSVALSALPDGTPASIRRLLRRCLEKNPSDRLDSMATARLEIADATKPDEATLMSVAPPARARRSATVTALMVLAALAVGIAAGWALFRPRQSAAPIDRAVRFAVPLPAGSYPTSIAITPAGDTIILEAERIYVRGLSDQEVRPLPGTEGARGLFLSPDGSLVGFFLHDKIWKLSISGGDPLAVADVPTDTPGAGWGPNNTILFSPGWNSGLVSVSADGGGKPAAISTVDTANGELGHWWPELLPDGKTVLFTIWMAATGINDARLGLLDLTTGKHRVLMPGSAAKYLPSGHLVYFHAGTYRAVRFDPVAQRVIGDAVKVLPDARPMNPNGSRQKSFAMSNDGVLAYIASGNDPDEQLAWLTPAGVVQPIKLPPRQISDYALSPDGTQLVSGRVEGGASGLWITDLHRLIEQKLDIPGSAFDPTWSPTGAFLAFTTMRHGHFDVGTIRPGEGPPTMLIDDPFDQAVSAVSRDGKTIIIDEYFKDGSASLVVAPMDNPKDRKRLPIGGPPQNIALSPNDQWLAVDDTVNGRREINVQPFERPGASVRVTPRGGRRPVWSKTGSKLYYVRGEELVAATYSTAGGRFAIEREDVIGHPGPFGLAGVAPDGRFLISTVLPGQDPQIRVVLNWFRELK